LNVLDQPAVPREQKEARRGFAGQVVAISAFAFAISFLWNTLHPIVLPYVIAQMEPQLKNTYLGFISAAGLVLAIIVQPLAGGISDRSHSRWGRRRPYIAAGTLGDMVFLAMLALAGGYPVLFIAYCLLQVSSNVAHGPYQGFIPDLIPKDRQGVASGAKNLVELLALVIGSAIIGQLVGQGMVGASLLLIAIVLLVAMLITVTQVHERPATSGAAEAAVPPLSLSGVVAGLRQNKVFAWYVLSRFLILMGLAAVRTFAQNFLQDVLEADNPAAMAGELMTILGLAVLLVVLPAGYLADRFGRQRLNVLSAVIGAIGTALMLTVSSFNELVIFGAIVGVAVGIFMSANWALAMDLIPVAEAALFLGLTNLATAGAGAAAGLLGPMIDVVNRGAPGQGYSALFALSALMWLLGGIILARLPLRR
jgi:MFS family permease